MQLDVGPKPKSAQAAGMKEMTERCSWLSFKYGGDNMMCVIQKIKFQRKHLPFSS